MKRFLVIATLFFSLAATAQQYTYDRLFLRDYMQLRGQRITNFITDMYADSTSDNKIPTVNAVRNWVATHGGAGGAGGLNIFNSNGQLPFGVNRLFDLNGGWLTINNTSATPGRVYMYSGDDNSRPYLVLRGDDYSWRMGTAQNYIDRSLSGLVLNTDDSLVFRRNSGTLGLRFKSLPTVGSSTRILAYDPATGVVSDAPTPAGGGGSVGPGTVSRYPKFITTTTVGDGAARDSAGYVLIDSGAVAKLFDKGGTVYNVAAFDIRPDGTDITAKLNSLLLWVHNTNPSGRIVFNAGRYRINGQIFLPNNGILSPSTTQKNLIIEGQGHYAAGANGGYVDGGTTLELWHDGGPSSPRFLSTGVSSLLLQNIGMQSMVGTNGTPFVHTGSTTIYAYHCSFYGYNAAAAANEDVFVMGGNSDNYSNTVNSPFQGYGSVIMNCFFNRVRAGVRLQTFANAIVFMNNTAWNQCGSDTDSIGFVTVNSPATSINGTGGNVIAFNLIEMGGYRRGVMIRRSTLNTIIGNNFYDPNSANDYAVWFGTGASYNKLVNGYTTGLNSYYDSTGNFNTIDPVKQGDTGKLHNIMIYTRYQLHKTGGRGPVIYSSNENYYGFEEVYPNQIVFGMKNNSGSEQLVMSIEAAGTTNSALVGNLTSMTVRNANKITIDAPEIQFTTSNNNYALANGMHFRGGTGIRNNNEGFIGWGNGTSTGDDVRFRWDSAYKMKLVRYDDAYTGIVFETGKYLANIASGYRTDQSANYGQFSWVTKNDIDLKANLASPTFTGTPAAPTAAAGTNTTQLASTAFVQQELNVFRGLLDSVSSITVTTTNATPVNADTIDIAIAEVVTIEVSAVAKLNDGNASYNGKKTRTFERASTGTLTNGTLYTERADEYLGTGLSTATFTITNVGSDKIVIQWTGQAATIKANFKYTVHRTKIDL